jgi:hypothetical protein
LPDAGSTFKEIKLFVRFEIISSDTYRYKIATDALKSSYYCRKCLADRSQSIVLRPEYDFDERAPEVEGRYIDEDGVFEQLAQ